MNKSQKTVAIGAGSGVIVMLLSVYLLSLFLPPTFIIDDPINRLIFAIQLNVLAVLPLFIMIATVGNARFLSAAIDPLKHKEDKEMEIDGRVVDNTLQQNFVFFVGTLALSTVLPFGYVKVLLALAIVFVLARFAFWFGYRQNPLYRAPGMAATSYMNLGILLATLVLLFLK